MSSLLLQCAESEAVNEAEAMQIKEECADEDMWKNDSEDKLSECKQFRVNIRYTQKL